METGFALTAFLSLILNLILPEEIEDEETPELTADRADEATDRAEWDRVRGKSVDMGNGSDSIDADEIRPSAEQEKV